MRSFFTGIADAIKSLLSDEPKSLSLKRWISAVFAVGVLYMVWFFLNRVVKGENQETFRHLFNGLCVMIVLLTGAATAKDIIALRNGSQAKQDESPTQPPQGGEAL